MYQGSRGDRRWPPTSGVPPNRRRRRVAHQIDAVAVRALAARHADRVDAAARRAIAAARERVVEHRVPREPRDERRQVRDRDVGADPLEAVDAAGHEQRPARARSAAPNRNAWIGSPSTVASTSTGARSASRAIASSAGSVTREHTRLGDAHAITPAAGATSIDHASGAAARGRAWRPDRPARAHRQRHAERAQREPPRHERRRSTSAGTAAIAASRSANAPSARCPAGPRPHRTASGDGRAAPCPRRRGDAADRERVRGDPARRLGELGHVHGRVATRASTATPHSCDHARTARNTRSARRGR